MWGGFRLLHGTYTYDGDWLPVTFYMTDLTKDIVYFDMCVGTNSPSEDINVSSDQTTCSIQKIAPNSYKLHFELRNKIKTAPYRGKSVECHFKVQPHGGLNFSINCKGVLATKENYKKVFDFNNVAFYNLDSTLKNNFEQALQDARIEVWQSILPFMEKANSNLEFVKKTFPLDRFTLLKSDSLGDGNCQLILNIGSYLGLGWSEYGIFVFDSDKSGFKKIFSKFGYDFSPQIVKWKGNTGLLLGENNWDGKDEHTQLLIYKDHQFVPVFDYVYSNCVGSCPADS